MGSLEMHYNRPRSHSGYPILPMSIQPDSPTWGDPPESQCNAGAGGGDARDRNFSWPVSPADTAESPCGAQILERP
jgi:hypothetical protein